MYIVKNAVVVEKGRKEASYSWMSDNHFDLKTDAHTVVNIFVSY